MSFRLFLAKKIGKKRKRSFLTPSLVLLVVSLLYNLKNVVRNAAEIGK
jgi:hypothetical protein